MRNSIFRAFALTFVLTGIVSCGDDSEQSTSQPVKVTREEIAYNMLKEGSNFNGDRGPLFGPTEIALQTAVIFQVKTVKQTWNNHSLHPEISEFTFNSPDDYSLEGQYNFIATATQEPYLADYIRKVKITRDELDRPTDILSKTTWSHNSSSWDEIISTKYTYTGDSLRESLAEYETIKTKSSTPKSTNHQKYTVVDGKLMGETDFKHPEYNTSYTYDQNRLVTITRGDRTIVYSYTPEGKLATSTENGEVETYDYNDQGFLVGSDKGLVIEYDDKNRPVYQKDAINEYIFTYAE